VLFEVEGLLFFRRSVDRNQVKTSRCRAGQSSPLSGAVVNMLAVIASPYGSNRTVHSSTAKELPHGHVYTPNGRQGELEITCRREFYFFKNVMQITLSGYG
jgi:hypothetical protein